MKALLLAPMGSVHRRFNTVNIEALQDLGYEVHLAANFERGEGAEYQNPEFAQQCAERGIITHSFPYRRHEIKHNIKQIKPTRDLIIGEDYDLIHAHTETGGLILRLVGKTRGKRIYTPHGMSFYKGAPLKAQLVYRPIEHWICSGMDCNIAINQEEYRTLMKWNPNTASLVHGIGLDVEKYQKPARSREEVRKEFGIPKDAVVVLSIGELDDNKNHRVVVDALKELNAYYLICGVGPNEKALKEQAQANGMEDRLILAGYRKDIPDILGACDIFAFPSFHEGLPVSLLEAMAGGLPVVCSRIRGNVDVVEDGGNGYTCDPKDEIQWNDAIRSIVNSTSNITRFTENGKRISCLYARQNVRHELINIYYT